FRGWVHWFRCDDAAADRAWAESPSAGGGEATPDGFDRLFRTFVARNRLAAARAFVERPPRAADPAQLRVWRATLAARAGDPAGVRLPHGVDTRHGHSRGRGRPPGPVGRPSDRVRPAPDPDPGRRRRLPGGTRRGRRPGAVPPAVGRPAEVRLRADGRGAGPR